MTTSSSASLCVGDEVAPSRSRQMADGASLPPAGGRERDGTARLRIAFVVDRFGSRYGGAEAYGVALMRELAARHDITVLARDYDADCPLHLPWVALRAAAWTPSWLRVLWFAIRARRATRTGYDIVHSHMNGWCGDVEVAHVVPVAFNWRVRPLPPFKRLLSRISPRVQAYLGLEAARVRERPGHRVVAVSGLIRDQLRQAYGASRDFPVIPPGVVMPLPGDLAGRAPTRQALGYGNDDFVCLMVARNPMRKGLPAALHALAQLPASVRLLVVGCDVAVRQQAEDAIHAAWLDGRVQLLGDTARVAPYYAAADCCLHPTLNDSFGMVPLEAMSYGLPVVLSPEPWCGFAEYTHHGRDALLLDHPENAPQLAGYVRQLREDAALRERLADGARNLARRHGWSRIAEQYEQLYAQVMAERPAGAGGVRDDTQAG